MAEAARVLRTRGRFVFLAMHPCFVGPHAVFRDEDRRIGPGYRERARQFDLPAFQATGLRAKVGAVHVPLADMLNALLDQGLELRRVAEGGTEELPLLLGAAAVKVATP